MQAGVFYPFFRAHAHLDANRREPWLFGDEDMTRMRTALKARYALLPLLYTLFYESHKNGLPLMRPLWYEFANDTQTFDMDDGYMLGDVLLVNPVYSQGATEKQVYFPGNEVPSVASRMRPRITG